LDLHRAERTRLGQQLEECPVQSVHGNSYRRSDLLGVLLCASTLCGSANITGSLA
jgi:hypothetical protein